MLKFSFGNTKLQRGEVIFDLPAGHTCPFAKLCLAKTNRNGGKLIDGKDTEFRCYAASLELVFHAARDKRWHNFDLLKNKTKDQMVLLIKRSLPFGQVFRLHSSGDFFNQSYFDAWVEIAKQNPLKIFYAYTKALPFWIKRQKDLPTNFKLVASYGGTHDELIAKHNLKFAKVVLSEKEAEDLGLEIDHDDSHAWEKDCKGFALLIHGTQPAGTPAAKAWSAIRKARYG